MLEVELIIRLTANITDVNTIGSPETGEAFFVKSSGLLAVYNGTTWDKFQLGLYYPEATPAEYANLQDWVNESGINVTGVSGVSSRANFGAGNPFVHTTGANQPSVESGIYRNLRSVYQEGERYLYNGDAFGDTSDGPFTVVVCFEPRNEEYTADNKVLWGYRNDSELQPILYVGMDSTNMEPMTWKRDDSNTSIGSRAIANGYTTATGNKYIVSWVCSGTTIGCRFNGAWAFQSSGFNVGTMTVDAHGLGCSIDVEANVSAMMDGYIHELSAHNSALTADQTRAIENFMANKWGVTL